MDDFKATLQLAQAGRFAEAIASCRQILSARPDDGPTLNLLGLSLLLVGDHVAAVEPLEAGIRVMPKTAETHCNLGAAYERAGRLQEAIQSFRRALEIDQRMTIAWFNLGNALASLGHHSEAVAAYRRAVDLDPGNASAYFNLGNSLLALGRTADAVETFQTAAKIAPNFVEALVNLGNCSKSMKRFADAEDAYSRALQADGRQPIARLHLALMLAAEGRLSAALSHFTRLIADHPNLPAAHAGLGMALHRVGRLDEAIASLQHSLVLNPKKADTYRSLSAALAAATRQEEARQATHRSAVLQPIHVRRATGRKAGTILVLSAIEDGYIEGQGESLNLNVGLNNADSYFDEERFEMATWIIDAIDASEAIGRLPAYDIVYNSISDPDAMPLAIALAGDIVPRLSRPVINRPSAILETQRHRLAAANASDPRILMPPTIRVTASSAAPGDIARLLEEHRMSYPILMRQVGTHTGKSLEKIDSEADMAAYLAKTRVTDLYITQFVDFADDRALYTKMRVYSIDHHLYPVHLFVSRQWNVRGYPEVREMMRATPWMLEEKRRFLKDPGGYLGAAAYDSLQSFSARVPLEYFGIDFAIARDGRVFVFEANATMAHHYAYRADFPFSVPALDAATAAIQRLFLDRLRH